MSAVLWANCLKDGEITSEQADYYILFKFLDQIDSICERLSLPMLSSICDNTDMLVNLEQLELPIGMNDTQQLMMSDGVWIDAAEAKEILDQLLTYIQDHHVRFGMLINHHEDVVEELQSSVDFASKAATEGTRFNFSIVM